MTEDRMPEVTILEHPAPELAAVLRRGPHAGIGRAFDRLGARIAEAGIAPAGPAVGVYHDGPGPVPAAEMRSHAGVEIAPGTALPPDLERVALPGGRVAMLVHRGPYDGIDGAWEAAFRWLAASGEVPADRPPHERYLNDPEDTAPEDLRTGICVPLAPAAG